MLYTEDYSMRHYIGFSQIRSHIRMYVYTYNVCNVCTYCVNLLVFTCLAKVKSSCTLAEFNSFRCLAVISLCMCLSRQGWILGGRRIKMMGREVIYKHTIIHC